jgi:hypothetical protein
VRNSCPVYIVKVSPLFINWSFQAHIVFTDAHLDRLDGTMIWSVCQPNRVSRWEIELMGSVSRSHLCTPNPTFETMPLPKGHQMKVISW